MSKALAGTLVGVIAYVVFVALQAPVGWVINRVQQQLPGLAMSNVTGSMWRGKSSQVNYQGHQLDQVSWAFNPAALIQGCLGYQVKGQWQGQPIALNAGTKWNRQACVSDIEATVDLNKALSNSQLSVQMTGAVELDIDSVEFVQGDQLPLFSGALRWPEANIVAPLQLGLGEVTLDLSPGEDEVMRGNLVAEGGQIFVDGPVDIMRNGDFSVNLKIRSNGEMPEEIQAGLGTFAEYHDGSYHLEYSDNIYGMLQ